MITAHSGSDGYQDNSRAFILAMLDSNVAAFEVDCCLSPEGILYLSHDPIMNWTEEVMTLQQLYVLMVESDNQQIMVNVDCKEENVGPQAVALASEYNLLHRVVLSGTLTPSDYSATYRAQLFFNLENVLDYSKMPTAETLRTVFSQLSQQGIQIVQFNYPYVNEAMVQLAAEYKIKISVWTVNDPIRMQVYLDMGCYNVTSRSALAFLNS